MMSLLLSPRDHETGFDFSLGPLLHRLQSIRICTTGYQQVSTEIKLNVNIGHSKYGATKMRGLAMWDCSARVFAPSSVLIGSPLKKCTPDWLKCKSQCCSCNKHGLQITHTTSP